MSVIDGYHYENLPIQYTENSFQEKTKNGKFIGKIVNCLIDALLPSQQWSCRTLPPFYGTFTQY